MKLKTSKNTKVDIFHLHYTGSGSTRKCRYAPLPIRPIHGTLTSRLYGWTVSSEHLGFYFQFLH